MTKLSIVILSFNVKQLLLNCLKSIPAHADWEILVPDNGSTDDSLTAINADFPNVKLIANGENLGFAAGNNVALKQSRGEYVLLLNPDTIVYPQSIETVLKYLEEHSDVGAATCRVELADGSLDYSCHRGFPTPGGALLHFLGLKKLSSYTATHIPSAIHEIDALTGAFALIRRKAGQQVGWLDEDYFWNGEDLDFCYKLKEAGWKIMYLPQVKITHYKGSSAKATIHTRKKWALNSTEVMALFYRKHLAQRYPFFINWIVYAGIWGMQQWRSIMRA
ncbi:MAG: glycosyltransferase family 2 protein [bacterium]|nr:glycosyltransferase family 2 protein [bacterium]